MFLGLFLLRLFPEWNKIWIMDKKQGEIASGKFGFGNAFLSAVALLGSRHYVVSGDSMVPTVRSGQRLLVLPLTNYSRVLSSGDLVITRGVDDLERLDLKRIIGLPGQEIHFLDGLLFVDGMRLMEPYLSGLPSSIGLCDEIFNLGSGEYFVLGDNRLRSIDSRKFGPVPVELILGRVWFRYWPLRFWGRTT